MMVAPQLQDPQLLKLWPYRRRCCSHRTHTIHVSDSPAPHGIWPCASAGCAVQLCWVSERSYTVVYCEIS